MLNQKLFPPHLGAEFLVVYENLVREREQAKKNKDEDTNNSLKIAVNGSFGKFGNKYSILYSPQLVTQVTVTGQLSILMLIEELSLIGINAVSANTDGIVLYITKCEYTDAKNIMNLWEKQTGFVLEETFYKALYQKDVNNYLAIKDDNTFKEKGIYSKNGSALNSPLSKNPETRICVEAVEAFLLNKTPIKETIRNCRDITKFVSVRKVEGGAQKDGQYLGKVIRWYYAEGETGTINRVTKGDIIPKSEGARPLMNLPSEFPDDICYSWYEKEAQNMLYDLGVYKKPTSGDLFK